MITKFSRSLHRQKTHVWSGHQCETFRLEVEQATLGEFIAGIFLHGRSDDLLGVGRAMLNQWMDFVSAQLHLPTRDGVQIFPGNVENCRDLCGAGYYDGVLQQVLDAPKRFASAFIVFLLRPSPYIKLHRSKLYA